MILMVLPVLLETVGNLSHKSYLLAFGLACMLLVFLYIYRAKCHTAFGKNNSWNPRVVCVVLSAGCLLLNGIFAYKFRPAQAADYRTFFQVAKDLSSGAHPGMKDYVAMFPHVLGYAWFLSLFLRVFGQHLAVAVGLNLVFTVLSGMILFVLVLKAADLASATWAYLFWILCPSKMFYNTMSLSEPYYTFLLLFFFLLVYSVSEQISAGKPGQITKAIAIAAVCGGLLTLVQAARPIAAVPMIALILWILFLADRDSFRKQWKSWAVFILVLVAAYGVGQNIWRAYATEQLEQVPPALPGYNIYVGFNTETNGSYSDTDMNLLQDRYFGEYEKNAVAAQQRMLEDARERVNEARPVLARLMIAKLRTLLGDDEGGVYYAMESLSNGQYRFGCLFSNIWYYLICLFSWIGLIRLWHREERGAALFLILFAVGLILAQLLVEVAARYHYALIPILLYAAGFAFQDMLAEKTSKEL